MIDYLAQARQLIDVGYQEKFGSESERLAYQAARTVALASIAESLHTLATTLPQGTGDAPGIPAPSPAEPSLVTLDRADEVLGVLRRWREADRIFPADSAEWWEATLRLRDVADRIGGAL